MAENEVLTAEQEKQINEAYDKMLDAADSVKGEMKAEQEKKIKEALKGIAGDASHPKDNKMTEEDIEKIFDKLDDIQKSDPVLSSIANMPSNTGNNIAAPNVMNYEGKDTTQHEVKVTVADSVGSSYVTRTLSSGKFIIDFNPSIFSS